MSLVKEHKNQNPHKEEPRPNSHQVAVVAVGTRAGAHWGNGEELALAGGMQKV